MAINLVTKFLPYVDELFTTESKSNLVTNEDFDWTGAHTIKVHKVNTVAMTDYDRAGTGDNPSRYGAYGAVGNTIEEFTLTKDRSFTFIIDKLDADETGQVLTGAEALARQQREVIIPEIDKYVYGVMATKAGTKPEAVTLTADNIYDEIVTATEVMDDKEVPETDRSIIVPPAVYRLMKKCPDITMETDIGNDLRLKGVIAIVDGMSVIKIPAVRLPQDCGFLIAHPVATVAPVKLDEYKIHQDPPGISGELVEGRIVYDAFVLDNKKYAIYYQQNKAATQSGG